MQNDFSIYPLINLFAYLLIYLFLCDSCLFIHVHMWQLRIKSTMVQNAHSFVLIFNSLVLIFDSSVVIFDSPVVIFHCSSVVSFDSLVVVLTVQS